MPRRRRELTPIPPRRPRRCGRCTMFGHDRRRCHLMWEGEEPEFQYNMTRNNWRRHCDINAQYVAAGGFSHDVPEPQPPQPPKTPFELACENKCKITETEDCCICMEKLGDKNTATTACGHQFHFGCLTQHTRLSNSCPMCRTAICPEVPKRELKLPPADDVMRFAAGASAALGTAIGNMMSMDATQVEFVTEALGQVIADTNLSLMRNIHRRNQ